MSAWNKLRLHADPTGTVNFPLLCVLVAAGIFLILLIPSASNAIVAATAVLIIGFVAYPWQKERDHDLKLREEHRSAANAFFEASETFFAKLKVAAFNKDMPLPDDEYARLEAAKANLALRSDDGLIRACGELAQHLRDYRNKVKLCRDDRATRETRKARDEAYWKANQARIDALICARETLVKAGHTHPTSETLKAFFFMKSDAQPEEGNDK